MKIYLLITDENQTLLAFRHDLPEDMQEMVMNNGQLAIS